MFFLNQGKSQILSINQSKLKKGCILLQPIHTKWFYLHFLYRCNVIDKKVFIKVLRIWVCEIKKKALVFKDTCKGILSFYFKNVSSSVQVTKTHYFSVFQTLHRLKSITSFITRVGFFTHPYIRI